MLYFDNTGVFSNIIFNLQAKAGTKKPDDRIFIFIFIWVTPLKGQKS